MATALTRAILLLEALRQLDPELPAHHAEAFLLIAQDEGTPQNRVAERLDLSKSAIYRVWEKLGDGREGKPGLKVIEVRPDPADVRFKSAYLTPKGRGVINQILHLMES